MDWWMIKSLVKSMQTTNEPHTNANNGFINGQTLWTGNNHYYEKLTLTGQDYNSVMSIVNSKTFNNHQGYLATITSDQEYTFISYTYGQSFVFGASRVGSPDLFYWSGGPEKNMPMYRQSLGRCYEYCNWAFLEPRSYGGDVIQSTNDGMVTTNITTNATYTFIIEYGGLNDPYLPPALTQGGSVVVSQLDKGTPLWNLSTLMITMVPSGLLPAVALTITNRSLTNFIVEIPEGKHESSILFNDGVRSFSFPKYRYQVPYIRYLIPGSLQYQTRITLVGLNFGPSIYDGLFIRDSSMQECTNIVVIQPHTMVSCMTPNYYSDLIALYPLQVKVGVQLIRSYRIPFYEPTSVTVTSVNQQLSSWDDIRQGILDARPSTVDYNVAYPCVFTTAVQENTARRIYPWRTSMESFSGLVMNANLEIEIDTMGGPNHGKIAVSAAGVFNSSVIWMSGTFAAPVKQQGRVYGYDPSLRTIMDVTGRQRGELICFGTRPFELSTQQHLYVNTTGGEVYYNVGGSSGFEVSTKTFRIDLIGMIGDIRQTSDTQLGVIVPEGSGANHTFDVSIEIYRLGNAILSYRPPSIVSVVPPPTIGGPITFYGYNLGKRAADLVATFGSGTCTSITMIQTHFTARCTVPPGVGTNKTLSITLAGQTGTIDVSYEPPTIQFTSINQDTRVSIAGKNFGAGFQDIYTVPAALSQVSFTQNNPLVNYIIYQVTFPPTTRNGYISVVVGGQMSNAVYYNFTPVITSASSMPLTGGDLTLTGYFFNTLRQNGDPTNIELKVIDGVTPFYPTLVSSSNDSSTTQFIFNAPPGIGGNMLAYLTIDEKTSESCVVGYQGPVLGEIIQDGTTLSITGSYFGSRPDIVTVSIAGISTPISPLSMSNGVIVIAIPPSTTNSMLSVSVSDQVTPEYPFTLEPIITSVSSIPTIGGPITIDGYFFNSVDVFGNPITYSLTVDGVLCQNAYIVGGDNRQMVCQVGSGSGANKTVTLYIGSKHTNSTTNYKTPIITDIQQSQTILTIQGTNFIGDINKSMILFGSSSFIQPLTSLFDSQTNLWTMTIVIPDNTTNGGVGLSVDGLVSNEKDLKLIPYIESVSEPSVLGGSITIQGKYLSLKRRDDSIAPSLVYIDTTSNPCTLVNNTLVLGQLLCNAPSGFGSAHNLYVSIDHVISNAVSFKYKVPTITDFIQNGTMATIKGSSFGSNPSQILVFFGTTLTNYAVSTLLLEGSQESFQVTIPQYSKSGSLNVLVAGISSVPYSYQLKPHLINVTSPNQDDGSIIILGDYLSQTKQDGTATVVTVTIDGVPCTNIQSLPIGADGYEVLKCVAPVGAGSDLPLVVTIDGLFDIIPFTFNGPSLTSVTVSPMNEIQVIGKNWGSVAQDIKLYYGQDQQINQFEFNSTSNTITFTVLPNSLNELVYVEYVGRLSNSLQVLLYPIISSVTPSETSGSIVTVNGQFLNANKGNGDATDLVILFNGQPVQLLQVETTNSSYKLFSAPKGTGSHSTVTISIEGRSHSLENYTYQSPTIQSLVQDQSTLFIQGNNFGDSVTLVDLSWYQNMMEIVSVNHTTIIVNLASVCLNGRLLVRVDSLQANEQEFIVKPIITGIVNNVGPYGGQINITGHYLNVNRVNGTTTNTLITVGSSTCQFLVAGSAGEYFICKLVASSLYQAPLTVSIDGATSVYSSYTSLAPVVTDITSTVYNVSSYLIITGQHFYSPSTVTIGSTQCTNAVVSAQGTTINCTFSSKEPPSMNAIPVTVKSVSLESLPVPLFFYTVNLCGVSSNICNGRGTCIGGRCQCAIGYSGDICSIPVTTTPLLPTLSSNSPNATFSLGRGVEIATGIVYVRELGPSGATVAVSDLTTSTWTAQTSINSTDSISTTYTTILNNTALLSVTVVVFNKSSTTQFAGETIPQTARSFKHLITVKGWSFVSPNNQLEVIYRAVTPKTFAFNCTTASTVIYTNSSNIGALNNTLTSFLIDSPIGLVQSRFTSRSIIDQKVIAMRTYQLATTDPLSRFTTNTQGLYVAMTLSSFTYNATFDPSFFGYQKPDPTPTTCGTTTSSTTGGHSTTTTTTGGHTTKGSTTKGSTTKGSTTKGSSSTGHSSSPSQFNNLSQLILITTLLLNLLFI
ncbi:IPT/TIG domain-containing protein [Cavenderia fasciculata]|uniref:IPT/TIG domain-containing protein n=1 Tax=Cavenderia fasciculata TaxID=261658 RepID=F4PUZ2_CACFS|nr:IPT/TIG domain-containing protein [Cavenderia fasciculata]EGG21108.1 IPT/TIG domain-containing protein [Cavenderia fasciculata]|eukprot:XP_004358958.1 IPT/TIG domain-containing protein [Cavenderia fasciculata]